MVIVVEFERTKLDYYKFYLRKENISYMGSYVVRHIFRPRKVAIFDTNFVFSVVPSHNSNCKINIISGKQLLIFVAQRYRNHAKNIRAFSIKYYFQVSVNGTNPISHKLAIYLVLPLYQQSLFCSLMR